MCHVRTIDKTTEVATPRGVTPCSSDPKVEERIRVFTLTLKFLPVGRIPQQNPLTLSFHGSELQLSLLRLFKGATRRRLQFLFPLSECHVSERTLLLAVTKYIVSNYRLVFKFSI